LSILGLTVAALALLPTLVVAAEKDEMIISVRKLDENIQDVPIQVTLFNASRIDREGINTLVDVSLLTPSMQFDTGFWPNDTRISIRGLFARAGRPSAAVLIDGIDAMSESLESAGGSALLNQRILDIERIEVARGPQSALYGRGAFSGAINYVTRRPASEWGGSVIADGAQDGRYELQGIVDGPITDNLAFKVLADHSTFDGYYTNPNTGQDLGGYERNGVGFALDWDITDSFNAYLNVTYSDDESDQPAVVAIKADTLRILHGDGSLEMAPLGTACNTPPFPGAPGVWDKCLEVVTGTPAAQESQINIAPDPRTFDVDGVNPDPSVGSNYSGTNDETLRANLIMTWDFGPMALKSSTSLTDADQTLQLDTTQQFGLQAGAAPGTTTGNVTDAQYKFTYEQFYQEFQLSGTGDSKIEWLAGVNGFWEEAQDINNSRFWYRENSPCAFGIFPFVPPGVLPCDFDPDAPFGTEIFNKTVVRDTTSLSAFGLISFPLFTDSLKLTLEGRVIYDEVEVKGDTSDSAAGVLSTGTYPGSPGFSDSIDDTNFVPRASLDWFTSDNVMLYGSIAKGIKPPTFNTTDLVDPSITKVKKEELWTYEIGAKTAWADQTVIVNGAIFYNDYTDQQVLVQFAPLPGQFIPRSGSANAGEVTVWGVELDTTWIPNENWLFNLSYAFTDGEFDRFNLSDDPNTTVSSGNQLKAGNFEGDFSGNDTPGSPRNSLAFFGKYQHAMTSQLDWYIQTTVVYQDERWADVANLVRLDDYTIVNAQIGIEQDNWFVSLYAENLFDNDTVQYAQEFIDQQKGLQGANGNTFPVAYYAYLPKERLIGVRVMYRTR
jgi:outer membrane receptor protein involved in Fe transport